MRLTAVQKDIILRALKTFIQAFLASWAVSNFAFDKNILMGAAAAAISLLWNTVTPPKPVNE